VIEACCAKCKVELTQVQALIYGPPDPPIRVEAAHDEEARRMAAELEKEYNMPPGSIEAPSHYITAPYCHRWMLCGDCYNLLGAWILGLRQLQE
jgi:hypothetical protein